MDVATGHKIGARSIMAGPLSMNIPVIRSSILISRRSKNLLSVSPIIQLVILAGICSLVRSQLNRVVAAMIVPMVALLSAASRRIPGKSLILISLYINIPTSSPYTEIMAPPSVAVKIPPLIPNTIISGIISAQTALLNRLHISSLLTAFSFG